MKFSQAFVFSLTLIISNSFNSAFATESEITENEVYNAADFSTLENYSDKDLLDLSNSKESLTDKTQFKKRPSPYKFHTVAVNIETNFSVPVIGTDKYFGRILLNGSTTEVSYRDEQVAHRNYQEERLNPKDFYITVYQVSKINSSVGLSLLKQAGAEVTLKSSGFTTKSGGTLNLKVKAPGQSAFDLTLQIGINGKSINNYLIQDGKKFAFDTLKINAKKALLTGTSILNGISSIEFTKNSQLTYTLEK